MKENSSPNFHPNHHLYHEWSKFAATEALSSAINHVQEMHGLEILNKNPSLLGDLTAAYARIYASHVIADAIKARGTPEPSK